MLSALVAMQIASTTPAQHCPCSHTPLESPTLQASSSLLTLEHLEQLFLRAIQATPKSLDSAEASEAGEPDAQEDSKAEVARASKLEFKTVNEVYILNGNCNVAKLTVSQLG
jgi:hypothetical protein